MITYKIDQKQLADLKKKLDSKEYARAIDIALFNIGQEMKADASQGAPKDTGTLSKSIEPRIEPGKYVEIGTDIIYAPIHEFGGMTGRGHSVRIMERPYMRPALERQKQGRAIDHLSKEINLILQK